MIGTLVSILYMAAFVLAGGCVAARAFSHERPAARLMLGCCFGLAMLMWLPALFSFAMGKFTLFAQIAALIAALMIGAFAARYRKTLLIEKGWFGRLLKREKAMLLTLLPFFILCLYLLHTHTLLPQNGALFTGQSTYGDMNLHLGFITSIAKQGFFPPKYSILPGTPVGYPFLNASVSSTLLLLGAPLRAAYILPMLLALACVFSGLYLFFEAWLKKTNIAVLATVLFLIGGGLGIWYFLDGSGAAPDNFRRIFTAFYETPTNYTTHNILWVNPIADMLIPQRATLFGWALLFPALFLLRRAADSENVFIPLGVLAGALPLVHTHSFLALGLVSLMVFIFECKKGWNGAKRFLPYILIAAVLALPQLVLFAFRQSSNEGFLRPYFNWANNGDPYFWFYIKNLGLIALLLPPAIAFAPKESRRFASGALLILVICECFVFQPNVYDNNKLLFVSFAFACGLVAAFLVGVYERLRGFRGLKTLAVITMCILTISGALTLVREAVSKIELYGEPEILAAEWTRQNAPPDAIFLTAPHHNNAISSLTGRSIVCGTDTFLYYHGIPTQAQHEAERAMYEDPGALERLKTEYAVDYAVLSDNERSEFDVLDDLFDAYPLVFEYGDVSIYAVSERARS